MSAIPNRNALLSKIHIAKKDLGLDDDTYRALLREVTGKTSAAELTERQCDQVLARFRQLGWKPKHKKPTPNTRPLADSPQARKLRALWLTLHQGGKVRDPSEKALCCWVKKQVGVDALQWLSTAQATQCINGLEGWIKQAAKQPPLSEPEHGAR